MGNKLRFDTSVFKDEEKVNLQLLIEFDGQQHFEWIKSWMPEKSFKKLQYHDILKNQYCISHNIPLIRIPYWEIDNIELILDDKCSFTDPYELDITSKLQIPVTIYVDLLTNNSRKKREILEKVYLCGKLISIRGDYKFYIK